VRPLLLASLLLVSCSGTIAGGGGGTAPHTPANQSDAPPKIPDLPAASTCQAASVGRTYRGLAGEVLEADRLDTDPSYDRLRPLPNPQVSNEWSLLGRIQLATGGDHHTDPAMRDPSVGNTFGNVPPRWYDEADIGAFSLSLVFNFAYRNCLYAFANQRNYRNTTDWFELTDAAPTPTTARTFCEHAVPHALSRTPSEAELQGCVDTILDVQALGEETDPPRIWAYGCAYAVSTPMYLTY